MPHQQEVGGPRSHDEQDEGPVQGSQSREVERHQVDGGEEPYQKDIHGHGERLDRQVAEEYDPNE